MKPALACLVALAAVSALSCQSARIAPAGSASKPDTAPVLAIPSFAFDGDDAQLAPFAAWVGDAEMVLLGEAHHGDAEGIAATVRLIRFLHERMGFDLLALEADLYGCARAWEGMQRGDDGAARLCTFRKDALSAAAAPFWSWLAARARGERPLALAGFDCQPSSEGSRTLLRDELHEAVGDQLDAETLRRALDAVEKLGRYEARASAAEHARDRASLTALASALDQVRASASRSPERAALLHQLGRSLLADDAQEWALQQSAPFARGYHVSFNGRDAQMAENLLWLRARHPGRKMVVWAATAHVARSLGSMPAEARDEVSLYVPMGQHVARVMGARAVHIGTLHAEGMVGLPNDAPFALPPAPAGFVEAELKARGFGPRALVDLRRPSDDTRWLTDARPARWYLSKRPPPARPERPADVVDVILFLEATRPNSGLIAPPARAAP